MGPYGSPRLRIGDYLMDWVEERRTLGELRPRTADRYAELIRLHITPAIGHLTLVRLAPPAVQHLYVSLLRAGLAPATVRQAGRILHAALCDAMKRGLITRNPCDSATLPKVERYEPTIWNPEQIAQYLDDALETATPPVYAVHVLSLGCGTRLGETLGIREEDVDLERRILRIRQILIRSGCKPVFGPPKTKKSRRDILMPEECVIAVRRALLWKKEQKLKAGAKFQDFGLVICSEVGTPLNPSNIRNRDHLRRLRRLGLPHARLHDDRHMHGSYLAARKVDARTGSDRMGHSDPGFFMRTYVHGVEETQAEAAAVANEMLTRSRRSRG